jgi:diguanylate cyclase (GGDEF)-like protein
MAQVADHLAELTGFRVRDVLDTTLVGVLRDLLRPLAVTVCHHVGEAPDQRWLVRARLCEGDVAASSDSVWVELEELPRLDSFPARAECLHKQEPVEVASGSHVTCFPLLTDLDAIGVLEVESHEVLDAEQLRTVSSLLRVYRNVQALLDYSERDVLTGLLNRKTFDHAFYKTCAIAAGAQPPVDGRRATRPSMKAYLGVIDIDHFKNVNDRFGHLIGDEVLLLLSRIMRGAFRFSDQLYRFGGEEFVVLLLCNDEGDAAAAFERFRQVVGEYPFPQAGKITVSVGFTAIEVGDTPAAAFERADRAVYHAKHNGRDQVSNHAQLVRQGIIEDDKRVSDVELF